MLLTARPAAFTAQIAHQPKEIQELTAEPPHKDVSKNAQQPPQHEEHNKRLIMEINTTALAVVFTDFWAWVRANNGWLAGILGWMGGTLVTHLLSLSAERRAERNTDAKALRERVMALLASDQSVGLYDRLTPADIDGLRQHLGCLGRHRLDAAYRSYQDACDHGMKQDAAGQLARNNAGEVRARLRAISKLAKRV